MRLSSHSTFWKLTFKHGLTSDIKDFFISAPVLCIDIYSAVNPTVVNVLGRNTWIYLLNSEKALKIKCISFYLKVSHMDYPAGCTETPLYHVDWKGRFINLTVSVHWIQLFSVALSLKSSKQFKSKPAATSFLLLFQKWEFMKSNSALWWYWLMLINYITCIAWTLDKPCQCCIESELLTGP